MNEERCTAIGTRRERGNKKTQRNEYQDEKNKTIRREETRGNNQDE